MARHKQRIVRIKNTSERPLRASEIVNATLIFANGGRVELEDALNDDGDMARLRVRHILDLATEDSLAAAKEAIRWQAESLERTSGGAWPHTDWAPFPQIIPSVALTTRDGPTMRLYFDFAGTSDLVMTGIILILDRERDFGSKLCRCHLESCRDFFLERRPQTGRPQRKYCRTEHMFKAHAEHATERSRRSRENRSKS